MSKTLKFLVLALGAGCFKPVSGDYKLLADGDPVTDCETTDADFDDDGDPVPVEVNDDKDAMTWGEPQPETQGYSNDCTLDGKDFTCTFYDDEGDDGQGNNISLLMELTGRWSSNTSVEGTLVLNGSCEGEGCADYEAFGVEFCNISQDITGELVE